MRRTLCLISFFYSSLLLAIPSHFPKALMVGNKPIDALCFFNLENSTSLVSLNECGAASKKWIVKPANEDLTKNGFIGYEWQDSNSAYPVKGYSYYKVFDAGKQAFWIYTVNGSGGTGEFTAVNWVKRKDKATLEVTNLLGGDRCNGGITEVKEKKQLLTATVNLTPYDLIVKGGLNQSFKVYDDVAACAVCCVGRAVFQISADLKPHLAYVVLDRQFLNTSQLTQQGKYQACFNKLLASYVTKGQTKLDQTALNYLAETFQKNCRPASV